MKRAKKYFGLFLLAGLILMVSNPSASAQDRQRKDGCKFLTEEQQEQAKTIRAKYQKDLTYLHNKLNELAAKQKTLIQVDKPNLKSLYANIEAKTDLHNKIAKTRTKMHIELRSIMTEEQRLMMGSGMGKKMMARRGMRGRHQMHRGHKHGNHKGCHTKAGKRMHRNDDCDGCGKEGRKGNYRNNDCNSCNNKGQKMHQRGMHGKCQENMRKGACGTSGCMINLTEEQQAAFKNIRLEKLKTVNPLKNKLKELQAKKHTLMSAEKINSRDINKIIDQMSNIKENIAKANIKQRIEMRKHLTAEQKMMFDKKMHGRKMMGKRMHGRCHGKF